jgi:hypothetical protein
MRITIIIFLITMSIFHDAHADERVYINSPQQYVSDFPGEMLSIQSLNKQFFYNDVIIPGNGNLSIVVTVFFKTVVA